MTAGERRRTPLHSVQGTTQEETDALQLLYYLGEVERQADAFCASLAEALTAAGDDDAAACWRHLQGAMFAAIILRRLVTYSEHVTGWPAPPSMSKREGKRRAKAAADTRVKRLREALHMPLQTMALDQVRDIRDALEHVDERIDSALARPDVLDLADWYLSDGLLLVSAHEDTSPPAQPGLRAFYPEAGLLFFDNKRINLLKLEIEVLAMRLNGRHKQVELHARVSESPRFGGHYLVSYRRAAGEDELAAQRQQRQLILDNMPGPVPPGNAQVWLEFAVPADREAASPPAP